MRPVATYSRTTNSPKNSSEVPRSRSSTRTPTLSSQIATTGPSTRPVGNCTRHSRRPAYASACPLAARYPAKNTASSTFANSPGCNENPAIRTQIRAPFTAGKKIGTVSRASAPTTLTYAYRWSTRWSSRTTTTTMNSATPRVDQLSWVGAAASPGVSRSSR